MPIRAAGSAALAYAVAVVAAVGAIVTTAVTVARLSRGLGDARHEIGVVTLDDLHEGQLEIAAAMVLTLVAAVLWGRFRRVPTRRHLLLFTSLCVLAADNLVSALFTAGFDSLATSRFATWTTAVNGVIGVGLLVLAAWVPDEPLRRPRLTILLTAGLAGAAVAGVTTFAWVLRGRLPNAFQDQPRPRSPAELTFLSEHPVLVAAEVLAACCWAAAAALFLATARRTGDELTGWIAVAATLAATSSVNYALLPSQYVELLYLGDYFFLAAVAVLLVAAAREIGVAEGALVDRALYSERRRIAREMHDGVTQELAFIASQTRAGRADPAQSDRALRAIRDAADRALDQSRSAIAELSGPVDDTLASSIAVTAQVVARRTGARVELSVDESIVVSEETRRALVRITRDALTHAVQNGAATVRVDLHRNGDLGLRIIAEGAVTESPPSSLELDSIRDRVAGLDGRVDVSTASGQGTTVEVRLP
jgi:signal transduction histidine kinase